MSDIYSMRPIAHIRSDFSTKFGVPRQSGLVDTLEATVVFEPEFRNPDALRGLEGFSHIWLVWVFSASVRQTWSPTVRPPRLGETPAWVSLPPAPPSAPIPSVCPPCGWPEWSPRRTLAPCCGCGERT